MEAEKLGVEFLGEIPLDMEVRLRSDQGQPIVVSSPNSMHAQIYKDIAQKVWEQIERGETSARPAPKMVIE